MRLPLLATLLAALLFGSATAGGNATLSCSIASGGHAGCYVERAVLTLGAFEVSLGIDAQAAWSEARTSHLTGYLLAGWYQPTYSVWAEFAIPNAVPVIGRPDAVRAGFSIRF